MPARGNPAALSLGPGYLYLAPIGTTEPVDVATALATVSAAWVLMGYTDTGSDFHYQTNTDMVEVAEVLDPLSYQPTSRAGSVQFALAQITATNLKAAFNGGNVSSGAGVVIYEPPDLGTEVRAMILFESEDHTERWIYRQCFQSGDVSIGRAKGAAKATIPVTFNLELPASGLRPWRAILASPQRA
jgi:hypothetical protein